METNRPGELRTKYAAKQAFFNILKEHEMNKLFERVAKLESTIGCTESPHLIKVRFIDPDTGSGGDAEITRIGCGDKTWHLRPNESQADFESRALSEARGPNLAVGYAE